MIFTQHYLDCLSQGSYLIGDETTGRAVLGEVTLEILATPGHTPESISVVVYEHPDDEVPYGVLTGDTLFVGDVGRPDLLSGEGLEGQAPQPHYFEFDSVRNREQRPLLDDNAPALLGIDEVRRHAAMGAILLDARDPAEYARGHLRGAVSVGLEGRFAESAGQVFPPDRDIVLVGDVGIAQESKIRLARVGLDRVVGQLDDLAGVFTRHTDLVETAARFTPEQLAELRNDDPGLQIVDVRIPGETEDGVVPGAQEIPLPTLTDSFESLDPAAPVVTYCASGYRSLVAASVLRAAGFKNVGDLLGGYGAWEESGAA